MRARAGQSCQPKARSTGHRGTKRSRGPWSDSLVSGGSGWQSPFRRGWAVLDDRASWCCPGTQPPIFSAPLFGGQLCPHNQHRPCRGPVAGCAENTEARPSGDKTILSTQGHSLVQTGRHRTKVSQPSHLTMGCETQMLSGPVGNRTQKMGIPTSLKGCIPLEHVKFIFPGDGGPMGCLGPTCPATQIRAKF